MARDRLIAWLQDAHAMEQMLEPILRNHANDAAQAMPDVAARDREHAEETRRHADRMREALERLGSAPSAAKSALANLMGPMQSVSTGMFTDELMENVLADYASEQFEVACYNALVTAAEELDEIEVAGLCRANLVEDQAMADWLDEQIPRFVRHTMQATKSTRP